MSDRKTLAELAAELDDPLPKDIDPEAFGVEHRDSEEGEDGSESAGREHYESVGKSKLRKQPQPTLGPQYSGSRVSRKDLDDFEDQDDDPFARRIGSDLSAEEEIDEEEYDDPDLVNIGAQDEDDEEIDSDEAFGSGDVEIFTKKGFTFKNSSKVTSKLGDHKSKPTHRDQDSSDEDENIQGESDESSLDAEFDELQVNGNSDTEAESEENSDDDSQLTTDNESEFSEQEEDSNADAIRAMLSAEQKNVVSGLSGSMKSEVAKGVAIKKQYATFDTLVGSRVHLQKSLIAANSIPEAQGALGDPEILAKAAEAAEKAATDALNSLTSLLHSVRCVGLGQDQAKTVLGKRPFSATASTSSEEIQQAITTAHEAYKSQRRTILSRWANKTQATTLSIRNRLVQKPAEDSLIVNLDGQLLGSSQDRLIQKTRIARSCAPLQQAAESRSNKTLTREETEEDAADHEEQDPSNFIPVYDDADFYALVLRELIDHKKSYTNSTPSGIASSTLAAATTPTNLLRGNKTKRVNVDTKASKGRKMKYTVHEKLQNFMAPVDLSTWERRRAEELFAGLLGRRVARLEEAEEVEMIDAAEEDMEMQGLRLFGSR